MKKVKKVVVLGAHGQLGSDIREELTKEDNPIEVIPFSRQELDLEKDLEISSFLQKILPFDALINASSFTHTGQCESEVAKAFLLNGTVPYRLAKFCAESRNSEGRPIDFFHISTDYVFDGLKGSPYQETDQPCPVNIYGHSKLAGELMVQSYTDQYFIFRVSSLFGRAGSKGKGGNFVETMLQKGKAEGHVKVVSDQIMSPTHTLDIARAIKSFLKNDIKDYGIYHCSGEGEASWFEFTKKIFELMNLKVTVEPVSYKDFPSPIRRPVNSVLDNQKLNTYFQMPAWEKSLWEYLQLKNYV